MIMFVGELHICISGWAPECPEVFTIKESECISRHAGIPDDISWDCFSAGQYAVMTAKDKIPEKTLSDLEIIIGKYIK